MKAKEAAEKWGCSVRTVTGHCDDGYVSGAKKEKNVWVIPDEALCPCVSNTQKQAAIYSKMIKAVNENKALNANAFHIEPYRFEIYCQKLCEFKMIEKHFAGNSNTEFYVLDAAGFQYIDANLAQRKQIIFTIIQAGIAIAGAGVQFLAL